MSTKNDFSLLRPFDDYAAKSGEAICSNEGEPVKYMAGPNHSGAVVLFCSKDQFTLFHKAHLRMAPLCWVEGRPVYKGDVLYSCAYGGGMAVATDGNKNGIDDALGRWNGVAHLSWPKTNVKREVKLVAFIDDHGCLRWIREDLFRGALVRVPSEDKVITIEDTADLEGGASC